MKKCLICLLALLLAAVPAVADEAELLERIEQLEERVAALEALLEGGGLSGLSGMSGLSGLSELERTAYEAVAGYDSLPRNTELTYGAEYYGHFGEHQLHLLLLVARQSEEMEMSYGASGGILLVDLETSTVYTHKDCGEVLNSEPADYDEALSLAFNAFTSYVMYMPSQIWSDSEILLPMDGDALARINGELMN